MGSTALAKRKSAARAKKLGHEELLHAVGTEELATSPDNSTVKSVEAVVDPNAPFQVQLTGEQIQLTAARLYGQGFKRAQIARALLNHLVPPDTICRTDEQKLNQARTKLRRWEYSQPFRDLVYQHAVVELDMSTPQILVGLAKRAKNGRVDAARLALELTGRHSSKDDLAATNVTVNLLNVARPE